MRTQQDRIIVATGATAHGVSVHHHDFPEIRAEGQTPKEAASHLANKLAASLDTALTEWRRQAVAQAIADVNDFVTREG